MTTRKKSAAKKRVSRESWLDAALELMQEAGIENVTIDELSRRVGVAKTSFYWHFKNRDQLLNEILEFWEHEFTEIGTQNALIHDMEPEDRLNAISEMVCDYNLARYETAITAWADKDPRAKAARGRVIKKRVDFIREAFRELGFRGYDLEMRTRLMVGYQSNEPLMFDVSPSPKTRKIRKMRIKLLTQQLAK